VYANIRDPACIVVIDAARIAVEGSLAVPSEGPHGLWLDSRRSYCGADGGELVVLDRDTGEVLRVLSLTGAPDVVMHGPLLQRLYVAIGDPGIVCSFDTERLELPEAVETEDGAHTTCWDRATRSLYVFCPVTGGAAVYEERL
jgi:hypothetical protein